MSILGFALPPDSGEKIALGNILLYILSVKHKHYLNIDLQTEITTLLSIIFFLQLLRESIPESSLSVPKLGIKIGINNTQFT
jgi:hypothetical protein